MNTRASDTLRDPPDGALTAAEYVLGVLDAAAIRSAEIRLGREPAFALDVAAWQARLLPLISEIAPVPVPFSLWPRVLAATGIDNAGAPVTARQSAIEKPSLFDRLAVWRWLTAGGFAATAASLAALFIATHPAQTPAPPPVIAQEMTATMAQDDGKALFVATIDASNGKLVVLPLGVTIPAGRVAELWLIPPGDAPHSLGLVDPQHAQPVMVPANLRAALGPKALVAVTIEPPGGSPSGKPTGPIIAKGEIALM
jgi:anti-sigma-K factor RskA